MPSDDQFVYSLELKILDLEKLVKELEKRIDDLEAKQASSAQMVRSPTFPKKFCCKSSKGVNPGPCPEAVPIDDPERTERAVRYSC
jgi:hypothetical protein